MLENLLIAWYRAPHGRSFHGLFHQQIDPDRRSSAFHEGRAKGTALAVAGGGSSEADWDGEIWVEDDRWRIDLAGSVRVQTGGELVMYTPGYGAIAAERDDSQLSTVLDLCWRPRRLIGAVEIVTVSEGTWLDRPCWRVTATHAVTHDRMVQLLLPGDRFVFTVDQDTGVVLRVEEWWHGKELSSIEWRLFEVVDDIDDVVFDQALPAGVVVRSQADVAAEHARWIGVDLSGVDTSDVEQIREAIQARHRHGLLDHHVASGNPPADPGEAEHEIGAAYANLGTPDGDDLPYVERGDGLASTVRRAAERSARGRAEITVSEIKFLSPERAAVVFAVSTHDGHRMLGDTVGEAVYTEQRWRVAHSTFAQLMRMAGVEPPPLPT